LDQVVAGPPPCLGETAISSKEVKSYVCAS
jgi:hypothetical protein